MILSMLILCTLNTTQTSMREPWIYFVDAHNGRLRTAELIVDRSVCSEYFKINANGYSFFLLKLLEFIHLWKANLANHVAELSEVCGKSKRFQYIIAIPICPEPSSSTFIYHSNCSSSCNPSTTNSSVTSAKLRLPFCP